VVTDGPLGDAPGLVIVPGGGYWDPGAGVRQQIADGALAARLLALHAAGTVLASVCTGAMLLSAAGLLRDRPAVTNKLALGLLARDGAQVRQEARVVDDGDIITAGGPMAGVDLAVRIVERYLGPDAALAAAGRLEHEQRGPVLVTARARAAV
jgi:transcriptional regulator GlxA family with amidase domain